MNHYVIWLGTREGGVLVLAPTRPDRHVPHGATSGPVPLTVLAEVARLVEIVVVKVTEFGVHAAASRAREDFIWLLWRILSF